jgi:hypothetical protein
VQVVPFKADHLERVQLLDVHAGFAVSADAAAALEALPSFTGLDGSRVLGCAGLIPLWPGRAQAWAYLDRGCGGSFVAIHREVSRFFDVCEYKRLEIIVRSDFPEAHRWARLLGFECEAPLMRAYLPCGSDAALYARVKP